MPDRPDRRIKSLLVLTHLYDPDLCGGSRIFTDMCRGLADRGIEVTVRCAYPHYPEWTDKSGKNGWRIERSRDHGVTVERYGMLIPRDPRSVWQRLLLEGSYMVSVGRSLWHGGGDYDAVMAFCPMAGTVAFAGLLRLISRRPLWLNVQDLPAEAAAAGGIARGGLLRKVLGGVQSVLFHQADVWSSISPVMMERLRELRRGRQPIVFLPNWLHRSISEEIQRWPSKIGRPPSNPVRLLYAGNIGTKQGLLDFCEVLHAGDTAFDFRIHGEGGVAAQVREWVVARGDSRFTFGPLLDEPGFVRALHESDLFVVTEKAGSGASFFPSKMVPCLASGTPSLVVCDPDSPLGREVGDGAVGPWFDWQHCREAPGLLATLGAKTAQFIAWQQAARQRSEQNDRERCLDLIEQTLSALVDNRTLSRSGSNASLEFPFGPGIVASPQVAFHEAS